MTSDCQYSGHRRVHRLAAPAVILAAWISSAGCSSSPLAQRQLAIREQQLGTTIYHWQHQEELRPVRLRRTFDAIDDSLARSQARSALWPARIERWWAADEADLAELDTPHSKKLVGYLLGGKPERIEPTFIRLFY